MKGRADTVNDTLGLLQPRLRTALPIPALVIALGLSGCGILLPAYRPTAPDATGTEATTPTEVEVAVVPAEDPADAPPKIFTPQFRETLYSDMRPETRGAAGADFDVDVAPDGGGLVFASTRYTETPKIFLRDADGAVIQKTSGPQRDIQPKFSPDGKWIAYASDREGTFDILIIPTDRNAACWQVTRSDGDDIHPTWSPDGKRLAYSSRRGSGRWNLMIVELNTRTLIQLGEGLHPEWSPDGDFLVFERPSRRDGGRQGIWIVPVAGGAPREVFTDRDEDALHPAWSPNSASLIFATRREPLDAGWETDAVVADDLWVVELSGQHLFRLTHHEAADFAAAWGLDDRIYFTSERDGTPRLWSVLRNSPGPFPPMTNTTKDPERWNP